MNLSQGFGSLAIVAHCNAYSGATLTLYSGTIPATPETAATGTSLYTFPFNSPGFTNVAPTNSGGYSALTASMASGAYVAAGTAGYARATIATPAAWAASHAYTRGALVTNNSNLYVMTAATGTSASSGGPTAGSYGIVDGSAVWDFVGASTLTNLADFTVSATGGGGDVQLGNVSIQSGVAVTISSFRLQVPTT